MTVSLAVTVAPATPFVGVIQKLLAQRSGPIRVEKYPVLLPSWVSRTAFGGSTFAMM